MADWVTMADLLGQTLVGLPRTLQQKIELLPCHDRMLVLSFHPM